MKYLKMVRNASGVFCFLFCFLNNKQSKAKRYSISNDIINRKAKILKKKKWDAENKEYLVLVEKQCIQ